MKGEFNQVCNRTDCSNKGATFYNKSTRMYYCPDCAHTINMYNRKDAMEMFGTDLCVEEIPKEEEKVFVGKYNYDGDREVEKLLGPIDDPYVYGLSPYYDMCKELIPKGPKLKYNAHYEPVRTHYKIGRNELCPCKSGKKYKKCCL